MSRTIVIPQRTDRMVVIQQGGRIAVFTKYGPSTPVTPPLIAGQLDFSKAANSGLLVLLDDF